MCWCILFTTSKKQWLFKDSLWGVKTFIHSMFVGMIVCRSATHQEWQSLYAQHTSTTCGSVCIPVQCMFLRSPFWTRWHPCPRSDLPTLKCSMDYNDYACSSQYNVFANVMVGIHYNLVSLQQSCTLTLDYNFNIFNKGNNSYNRHSTKKKTVT